MRAPPSSPVSWSDRRLVRGYIATAVAGVLGMLLLGRVMTNGDEYIYAGEARMLTHLRLLPVDGDPLPSTRVVSDFESARYPPGWPLILALGAWWSFRSMFVVALATHLLAGVATARMMVRRGLPSDLAAVWLFHPLFWSSSRTLMSDVPAAALLLMAMDAWENRSTKTSALAIGYAVLVRIASLTHLAGFMLAIGKEARHRRTAVITAGLGMAAGLASLSLVNMLKYHHPFHSPYVGNNLRLLTTAMVVQNLWVYGLGLLVIPPFPLACLLVRPKSSDRWALVALPVVLFFLFYGYRELASTSLENLFRGQRLILAAHAGLLIATADIWSRIPGFRRSSVLLTAGIALALAHHLWSRHIVDHFAPAAQAVAACRPDKVAFNIYAGRVALSTDALVYHLLEDNEPTDRPDVVVITLRYRTDKHQVPIGFHMPEWLNRSNATCRQFGDFYVLDLRGRCPSTRGHPCDLAALTVEMR